VTVDPDADVSLGAEPLARTGLDGLALKPADHDLVAAAPPVAVDYEGREHLPAPGRLRTLAEHSRVYLTAPVRADGFDPLGDDSLYGRVPEGVGLVFVAGNAAYLDAAERSRAVAPRLRAALDRTDDARPAPWVGTEGIERLALATDGVQYDLLSRTTEREMSALRAVGFEGGVAVYAPTVLSTDDDAVLDAVGAYAARRRPVGRALPDGAPTDSTATGRARERLLEACRDYALVGDAATVRGRVKSLRSAGVDTVVGYPARGLDAFG